MLDQLVCLLFCSKVAITQITTTHEVRTEVRQEEPVHKEPARQDANVSKTFKGYVSTYTNTWAGCLGCTKYYDEKGQLYYKMANGERLDDSRFTIAFYDLSLIPLNRNVSLVNTNNGKSVAALVTDTGGFMDCCNRIADLSLAVANSLGARTDKDLIEIIPIIE